MEQLNLNRNDRRLLEELKGELERLNDNIEALNDSEN